MSPTQTTYTYFFQTDLTRATDRSQESTWSALPVSVSSNAPVATYAWVKR